MSKQTTTQTTSTNTLQYNIEELNKLPTMSAKIRYLNSKELKRVEISKILNIRYQWVRNVLITPIKKEDLK